MMQGSLAERLRVLRAQDGLTLNEASAKIGINRHTLRDLELGKREPYGPTIRKIAEAYNVSLAQLLEKPALTSKADTPSTERPEAKGPDPKEWGPEESRPDPTKMQPGPGGRAISRSVHDQVTVEDEVRVRVEKALRVLRAFDAAEISAGVLDKELQELYEEAS
jgi:transcriptional regulator with XRE-family HTH domain